MSSPSACLPEKPSPHHGIEITLREPGSPAVPLSSAHALSRRVHALRTRERILQAVNQRPGIAASEVVHALGIGWSTFYRHVRDLQREGRVRVERAMHYRVLYPVSGAPSAADPPFVLLKLAAAKRLAQELERRPGHDVRTLAASCGLSLRVAYYHVRRLVEADLVRTDAPLHYRGLRVAPAVAEFLRRA